MSTPREDESWGWSKNLRTEILSDLADAGYVVVPKEPSERMIDAALKAADACRETWIEQIEDAVRAALGSEEPAS